MLCDETHKMLNAYKAWGPKKFMGREYDGIHRISYLIDKNGIVKQIFEKLNYRIIKLDRVFLAGLTKKDLPRKHYRHLTQEEINLLKRL